MYTGYFRHVGHTENGVNELGEDVEILLGSERRSRRLAHEEQKWDEEHYMCVPACTFVYTRTTLTLTYRADYGDDEWIQELISFVFPPSAPCAHATDEQIIFTPEEDLQMLRLPQKECEIITYIKN